MGVLGGFAQGEHGRDAGVGALEKRAPLGAGLRLEQLGEARPQPRPPVPVHLLRQVLGGQVGRGEQLGVELRLEGSERDEGAVGALVGVVERRPGVEHVAAAVLLVERAEVAEPPNHRHQDRGAVDHRRVDDLALARGAGLEDPAHDAEREEHAPATEVADHVDRRSGLVAGPSEVGQRAGEGDVVDVVSRGLRHRTVLTPAGHAPVHEPRVPGEARVGPDTEPVGDPGPEPFEERVGFADQTKDGLDPVGMLEVDADGAAVAVQDRDPTGVEAPVDGLDAVDPQHVGAHVGEEHRRERPRAAPDELDDLHPCQRPGHVPSLTSASP